MCGSRRLSARELWCYRHLFTVSSHRVDTGPQRRIPAIAVSRADTASVVATGPTRRSRASSRPWPVPVDPADPMERTDPADPMDRIDPAEPIERTEPADPIDSVEKALPIQPDENTEAIDLDENADQSESCACQELTRPSSHTASRDVLALCEQTHVCRIKFV